MSGLIPQHFIDELLQRTDIVNLIDSFVPLKKSGANHSACCPFHHEKTPSFNVVPRKQFYHCFGCGASGNAIGFIMAYLNQSFPDAVETLAARQGLTVPREGGQSAPRVDKDLYKLMEQISEFYQQQLKHHGHEAVAYLKNRGLSGEIAKKYQLGFAPDGWHVLEQRFRKDIKGLLTTGMLIQKDDLKYYDRYRQRVMFPIHDRHGRIIGFGGRALTNEQQPKYLNSPETPLFQKSRELYGLHQVLKLHKNPKEIIVVEGYMDVIALAQYGIDTAVATLGTATSSTHIQLLAKHCQRLIFCFDGDRAGKQAAWRALESSVAYMNEGLDIRFNFLPDGEDPDSMIRTHGQETFQMMLRAESVPWNRFFINTLSIDIDIHSPAGKARLIEQCTPYLKKMGEGSYQQLLIEELSRLTRIDTHRLSALIGTGKKQEQPVQIIKSNIQRSPVRMAVAMLLQQPELYTQLPKKYQSTDFTSKEHAILAKIIQCIEYNPKITTASLVEYWRDSQHFEIINKLAGWDPQVPQTGQLEELADIFSLLTDKSPKQRNINQLIEKSKQEGLTMEEKIELQKLLISQKISRH